MGKANPNGLERDCLQSRLSDILESKALYFFCTPKVVAWHSSPCQTCCDISRVHIVRVLAERNEQSVSGEFDGSARGRPMSERGLL